MLSIPNKSNSVKQQPTNTAGLLYELSAQAAIMRRLALRRGDLRRALLHRRIHWALVMAARAVCHG